MTNPKTDPELSRLEEELTLAVRSDDLFLTEIASHLIGAGGKRIRPMLTIQSALASGGEITSKVLQGAASVELVHLASLHHDDVMDEASFRRGVESVNARWGNLVAVVAGDYLLAKAAAIAARLSQEVAELLANTLADMCAGQVLEVKSGFDLSRSSSAYLEAISGKTASLMATSCRIGAVVSGAPPQLTDELTELGSCFGMIFQLRDDIFDLLADELTLGKIPGQDIIEGVYTLPIILALKSSNVKAELKELLNLRKETGNISRVNMLLLSSGAMNESFTLLTKYLERANDLAYQIGNEPAKKISRIATDLAESVEKLLIESDL